MLTGWIPMTVSCFSFMGLSPSNWSRSDGSALKKCGWDSESGKPKKNIEKMKSDELMSEGQ